MANIVTFLMSNGCCLDNNTAAVCALRILVAHAPVAGAQGLADSGWSMFYHPLWSPAEIQRCLVSNSSARYADAAEQLSVLSNQYLTWGGVPNQVHSLLVLMLAARSALCF